MGKKSSLVNRKYLLFDHDAVNFRLYLIQKLLKCKKK